MFACSVLLLALFASAQGRAVNISNTWVLPEEGFPVFYRYFRDRISWYEADAVCQFHHANLVTVDTTAQYDAVRAYLKELDISSAVWVGLIRSNPDGDFTWTDYRGLSGDGYWSAAPDARSAPLCAAADPAADYRWEARACGGPTVASFICELPVPQWALGNDGCMVRALPALTILYLPESAAVQLTADCGLAGVKKVQCTGNVKREDLLKNLSCSEEEELTSASAMVSEESSTSSPDQAINATELELTTDGEVTTRLESVATTQSVLTDVTKDITTSKQQMIINKLHNIYAQKNMNLDLLHNNNLQSNDIPKLANNDNFLAMEESEKLEDEKHLHHKMLHDELAKHGNFETIFTQPTDHFIPPLVMAKAKISDDMTVLSLAEKHAQQLAEQQKFVKHNLLNGHTDLKNEQINHKSVTEAPKVEFIHQPIVITLQPTFSKDNIKKDKPKTVLPKKYIDKYGDPKLKNVKIDGKLMKFGKSLEKSSTPFDMTTKIQEVSTTQISEVSKNISEDNSLQLTVTLKETKPMSFKLEDDIAKIENIALGTENVLTTEKSTVETKPTFISLKQNHVTSQTTAEVTTVNAFTTPGTPNKQEISSSNETSTISDITTSSPIMKEAILQDVALNHEIIRITIVDDIDKTNSTHTMFEVTTLVPQFKDDVNKEEKVATPMVEESTTTVEYKIPSLNRTTTFASTVQKETTTSEMTTDASLLHNKTEATTPTETKIMSTELPPATKTDVVTTIKPDQNETRSETKTPVVLPTITISQVTDKVEILNITEIYDIESDRNFTDPDAIDDYNSPLLSAANEPLHRPNRSRRPQPPNRLSKFNPFRMLG